MNAIVTRQEIDGIGTVLVDDTGRMTVLSDACGEMFDHAMKNGMTADELVCWVLDQAEKSRVEGRILATYTKAEHVPTRKVVVIARKPCRRAPRHRHGYRDPWHQRHN